MLEGEATPDKAAAASARSSCAGGATPISSSRRASTHGGEQHIMCYGHAVCLDAASPAHSFDAAQHELIQLQITTQQMLVLAKDVNFVVAHSLQTVPSFCCPLFAVLLAAPCCLIWYIRVQCMPDLMLMQVIRPHLLPLLPAPQLPRPSQSPGPVKRAACPHMVAAGQQQQRQTAQLLPAAYH